jgi:membrane associated rhomboid family serine protease
MGFRPTNRRYAGRGFGFGPGAISPFIKAMLGINLLMFVLQQLFPQVTASLALDFRRFGPEFPNLIYQLFTYMFLHGGFLHIFFNMLMLWMFGTEIELTWGSRAFGRFYLMAGLAGGVLALIFPLGAGSVVGASGAIWGVFIAYWLMYPNRMLYLYFMFPVKVKYAIPGLLLLSILIGSGRVAHAAHVGGALFGLLYLKMDWQWIRFGRSLKNLRSRRQEAKLIKRRQEATEVMKRVDAILDKINEVGIENLSESDRKFLEEASSELSRKKD